MIKPHKLKLRHYSALLVGNNAYLVEFPGEKLSGNIGQTELNEIVFSNMPNGCIKKAYMQGFYCNIINFKILLTCLNAWKFCKYYMKLLWNLIIKTTGVDYNCVDHRRQNIVEVDSSNIYSSMGKHASKCRKRYAYFPRYRSQLTCLIHVLFFPQMKVRS